MLVEGTWKGKWHPYQKQDNDGRFLRQTSSFRNWVTANGEAGETGEGGFKVEEGRYHLYVALICPWASRTLMARVLLGLEEYISVSIASPVLTDEGWAFGNYEGATLDTINGASYMHEIYTKADPEFTGRATVPVLWDKKQGVAVNNESADILRMLSTVFAEAVNSGLDLYPVELQGEIDRLDSYLYKDLNNAIYQAGFATTQEAYEEAVQTVFHTLDEMEALLADGRNYILGSELTEADIRLFVSLIRFDVAYFSLFKTNIRAIADYEKLSAYLSRVYNLPGVKETVNFQHIKAGYYSIKALNPTGIIPVGPNNIGL